MSLFLALAAQVTPVPSAPPSVTPEVANEIVVIGRKIKTWKGRFIKKDGQLSCRTTKSTRDAEIDAIRCGAMITCTRPVEAEIDRLYGLTTLKRIEKERQINALLQTTIPCMDEYFASASLALAERRVRR